MTDKQKKFLDLLENRFKLIELALTEPVLSYHIDMAKNGVEQAKTYLAWLRETL